MGVMENIKTLEFIKKAKNVHGDKYDYSLTEYKNVDTHVDIICNIHGIFRQTPYKHVNQNHGCPKCSKYLKLTTIDFINKSREIFGDKYDYSLAEYINCHTKVKIICPIHGVFQQLPSNHYRYGCRKCSDEKSAIRMSKPHDVFMEDVLRVHGNKYDYSKVQYRNQKHKITIICPIHGDFTVLPSNFVDKKSGCPKCANENNRVYFTKEQIIKEANEIHNNFYKYNLTKDLYQQHEKFEIICPIHGKFLQDYSHHIKSKQKCKRCKHDKQRRKQDEFIHLCKKIYENEYDYSLVKYKQSFIKVKIICKKHGVFSTRPCSLLRGNGCPHCKKSKGEKRVAELLRENNIIFHPQKTFKDLKLINRLRLDFYLSKYKIIIEYNGRQHYEETKYFKDSLQVVQLKDNIKKQYAYDKGMFMFIIRYDESIEDRIQDLLVLIKYLSNPIFSNSELTKS